METRICSYCKEPKQKSEFRIDRLNVSGLTATCNSCNNILQKNWYKNNAEKARLNSLERYHKYKEAINEKRKLHRKLNPEKYKQISKERYHKSNKVQNRESSWKNAGIKDMTVKRYDELFAQQNESCAVCKEHQSVFKRSLCVDHDHATGIVRGLLCDNCNRALGYLKESKLIMNNMIKYITNENY